MPDFRDVIRRHLATSGLSATSERSVVEEINAHMEDRYNELRAGGVSETDALRMIEGELTTQGTWHLPPRLKQRTGSSLGSPQRAGFLRGLISDIRYAARSLWHAPAFALSAILALGAGTGAATAVFSLVNGVLLQPLPYPHADRLVMLWETNPQKGLRRQQLSPVSFMDYRSAPGAFVDAAAWWTPETSLSDDTGEPLRVATVETSENLFDVLGVHPQIGRAFERDSTLFGKTPEAVISDALWHQRFGASRSVIGKTIRLNGYATTIIGVMPPGFHFPDRTDLWWRLSWDLTQHNRGARFMGGVARLRPGVTLSQVNASIHDVAARIASENPSTNEGWNVEAIPLATDLAGVFRPGLIALFGASTLLLLIACLNVANLLLARSAVRSAEIAIRSAVGADRWRIVRQLLTESLMLGLIGSGLGFIIAAVAVRGVLAWSPVDIPRADNIAVDHTVMFFAASVAIATAALFGLLPAIRSSRANLQTVLRQAGRSGSGSITMQGRGLIVVCEVALSVALLCGAGLLTRTVSTLAGQDTGVRRTDAVAVDLQLPDAGYGDFASAAQFHERLLAALRASPSVSSAGVTNFMPLETGWRIPFERASDPPSQPGNEKMVQYQSADGGYFDAIGARVLRGRAFNDGDRATSRPVVMINETMARMYWPNEDPVGKIVRSMGHQIGPLGRRLTGPDEHEVIGVVSDIRNATLTEPIEPTLYSAPGQFPFLRMYVVVRGRASAAELTALVRSEVRRLDASLPLGTSKTIARVLGKATDPPRFLMTIMTAFAMLAVLLAAFGVYGLLAYMVNQRKREFGIRMAMGASRGDVLRLVLRQGALLGVGGALLGILCAFGGTRIFAAVLYGVTPRDTLTLTVSAIAAVAVTVAAASIPALRATRVEPMRTLRE